MDEPLISNDIIIEEMYKHILFVKETDFKKFLKLDEILKDDLTVNNEKNLDFNILHY